LAFEEASVKTQPKSNRLRNWYGVPTVCLLALALAGCSGGGPSSVLFSDDFKSGASTAWSNDQGNWRAIGGQYDATNPAQQGSYTAVATLPNLSDFAIDVDVNAWNDGGIWLRSNFNGGNENGILFVTGGNTGTYNGFYWHVVTNGVAQPAFGATPIAGLQGTNHHLRIEVSGSTYSAFIDGSLVGSIVDATYGSGMVGLYDFSPISGAANPRGETFSNVVISKLP
jgi:hypothetical protein